MTKADLAETVAANCGYAKKEAAELVELFFSLVKDSLEQENELKISGFGKFAVKQKKPRRGRNPQTGSDLEISARKVLTFKPSPVLRDLLNSESK